VNSDEEKNRQEMGRCGQGNQCSKVEGRRHRWEKEKVPQFYRMSGRESYTDDTKV
jgi:hypothetical protein